jgi:hypothetical protein
MEMGPFQPGELTCVLLREAPSGSLCLTEIGLVWKFSFGPGGADGYVPFTGETAFHETNWRGASLAQPVALLPCSAADLRVSVGLPRVGQSPEANWPLGALMLYKGSGLGVAIFVDQSPEVVALETSVLCRDHDMNSKCAWFPNWELSVVDATGKPWGLASFAAE